MGEHGTCELKIGVFCQKNKGVCSGSLQITYLNNLPEPLSVGIPLNSAFGGLDTRKFYMVVPKENLSTVSVMAQADNIKQFQIYASDANYNNKKKISDYTWDSEPEFKGVQQKFNTWIVNL